MISDPQKWLKIDMRKLYGIYTAPFSAFGAV